MGEDMQVKTEYKQFITDQLVAFQTYDDQRPADRTYRFVDHSRRVANNIKLLAIELGYADDMADALYWAMLIHDIGKITMPVDIWDYDVRDADGNWQKPPDDIKDARRQHTIKGVEFMHNHFGDLCDTDPFLRLTLDIMAHHHEHNDGTGFLGKTADELSEWVQMACICDSFDGWTIPRPHKKPEELEPSYVIDTKMSDGRFNLDILNSFKKVIEK